VCRRCRRIQWSSDGVAVADLAVGAWSWSVWRAGAGGGHRLLDASGQLGRQVAAGDGLEAEQRRFAQCDTTQQIAVTADHVEGR
jgi:hypothetical protein